MILLQGHSLTPASNVPDEALSITLSERESTATWTPASMTGIGVNSWIKSRGGPADGIVWRVQSIQQAYATATPTVQLEHTIKALGDTLLFGEITPKEITGSSSATACTARQAVEYILSRQSDWTLGDFDFGSVSNPYKFNGDTLLDALETVSDSLEGAWWSYDFSAYPFRLNITEKPEGEICEMRANRNLTSVTKTIDRSGMYTRFYPIGKDDLHIPGDYASKNENLYGTVSKVEVDQSITTVAELQRWANERLNKHAEPIVTVTADGLELSEATGQPLDALTLGRICRIPLPEFSTTIEERITEISYPDLVFQPEVVRITMANQTEDLTKILADVIRRGGGGGRAAAVQDKVDHAWIEDTDEYVALIATDFEGLEASLVVTASQIRAEVADDVSGVYSTITQTASSIRSEVRSSISSAYSSIIEQTDSHIRSEVGSAVSGIYTSVIEQTGSYIRSEISAAASGITSSVIEQTGSYIRSEIQNAGSEIYGSVILQTESFIRQAVSGTTKTYINYDDPSTVPVWQEELKEGDLWHKTNNVETWESLATLDWSEAYQYDWQEYLGGITYIRRNGEWVEISNEQAVALNTQGITETDKAIRLAKADSDNNFANLLVTASLIRSEVKNTRDGLSSTITQTASQIRMEVNSKTDAASIVAGINAQTGSYVKIAAKNINLTGYTTVSELDAAKARITDLEGDTARFNSIFSGVSTASYMKASTLVASGSFTFKGHSLSFYQMTDMEGRTRYLLGHA